MELIDIGANLAHDSFDEDRDAVLARAEKAGVTRLIVTGSSTESNKQALVLARSSAGRLFATAGMHPHHASDYSDAVDASIRRQVEATEVVAVGECGLDYFRDISPRPRQREAFERQLAIGAESGLPVFLHQRDAHEDFVAILAKWLPKISRAVAHCFTGDREALETYLEMGLYIGITGWICDERRGAHLQDIVSLIPDDRLMLETDAPYLLPRSLTPKPKTRRNEPAYLTEVLRVVASSRDQTPEHVAAMSSRTAEVFFALP